MPSSSIASWAAVTTTGRSLTCGQMKRPFSSRFASRQRPSPSHHSSLTRSPLRPRKTNSGPEKGYRSSRPYTRAAKRSKLRRMSAKPQASQTREPRPDHREKLASPRSSTTRSTWPRTRRRTRGSSISISPRGVEARVAGGGVSGTTASPLRSASALVDECDFSIHARTRLA